MPTPARFRFTSMHDPRLGRILAVRGKATVLGVGRDICLLAVAAVLTSTTTSRKCRFRFMRCHLSSFSFANSSHRCAWF
jgi:hypothetical protein